MPQALFEGVDILDTLQSIVDFNTYYYKTDFNYDKQTLEDAALRYGDNKHFLWLSRRSGTQLYPERDVFIRGTAPNNSWKFYGESKSDSVMAYLIQVIKSEDHILTGNILELDYQKHLDFIRSKSPQLTAVELVFKNPNHVHTVSAEEWQAMTSQDIMEHGLLDRKHYVVENEQALRWVLDEAHYTFMDMAEMRTVPEYIAELEKRRFADYGYTTGKMVFATPVEAENALRHSLHVYALHRDGTETQVSDYREIQSHYGNNGIFGMSREELDFLRYLQLGKNTPTLFTGNELREIYCNMVQAGMNNTANDPKLLDSVIYKLERTMPPSQTAENELSLQAENEMEV